MEKEKSENKEKKYGNTVLLQTGYHEVVHNIF